MFKEIVAIEKSGPEGHAQIIKFFLAGVRGRRLEELNEYFKHAVVFHFSRLRDPAVLPEEEEKKESGAQLDPIFQEMNSFFSSRALFS